ncbi:MAG: hypothetical protein CMB64_03200 [Euryarchaeota archaeon]|mgnify:CR=1 FL=1|nr:hypothetical protein [Euryarchaeota archaeon]
MYFFSHEPQMKKFSHVTSHGMTTNKLEFCKRPGAFGSAGDKVNIPLCDVSRKTMEYMIAQAEQQMKSVQVPEAGEKFERKKLETESLKWLSANIPDQYEVFLKSTPPPTLQDKIDFYFREYTNRMGAPPPFENVPSVTKLQPPKNSDSIFTVQSSVRIPYDKNNYAYHFSKHITPRGGYYLDGVKDSDTNPPAGRRVHKYEVDEMITYLDGELNWQDGHYHDYRRLPKSIRDAYAKIIVFNLCNDSEIQPLLEDSTLVGTWT